jgi:hypothetical protein
MLMNMRSVLANGSAAVALDAGQPWAAAWHGPESIVFGHDAVRGLQTYAHAVGIDTGCVYGGALSGIRWPSRDREFVAAKRTYAPV